MQNETQMHKLNLHRFVQWKNVQFHVKEDLMQCINGKIEYEK